jgi:hypothetical protein
MVGSAVGGISLACPWLTLEKTVIQTKTPVQNESKRWSEVLIYREFLNGIETKPSGVKRSIPAGGGPKEENKHPPFTPFTPFKPLTSFVHTKNQTKPSSSSSPFSFHLSTISAEGGETNPSGNSKILEESKRTQAEWSEVYPPRRREPTCSSVHLSPLTYRLQPTASYSKRTQRPRQYRCNLLPINDL